MGADRGLIPWSPADSDSFNIGRNSLLRTRPKALIFNLIMLHALRLCPSLLASLLLASLLLRVRAH